MTDAPITQPTSVADLVGRLERDLAAAREQNGVLAIHLAGVRDTLIHLVQQLDALGNAISEPSAAVAAVIRAAQPDEDEVTGPRGPRQSPEERDEIDATVLDILREYRGREAKVATIAAEAQIDPREVSKSVQRLRKRTDVDVRPGNKTGSWLLHDAPTVPAQDAALADDNRGREWAVEDIEEPAHVAEARQAGQDAGSLMGIG
jgi:hypothetical protein